MDPLTELRAAQHDKKGSEDTVSELLAALQEQIKGGQSTGDPITDVVILEFEGRKSAEDKIRSLDASLREHKGELVALQEDYHFSWGNEGCFGGGHSRSPSQLLVGRVQEPCLKFYNTTNWVEKILGKHVDAEICVDPLLTIRGDGKEHANDPVLVLRQKPSLERQKNIPLLLGLYVGLRTSDMAQARIEAITGARPSGFFGESASTSCYNYTLHVGTPAVDALFEELSLIWLLSIKERPKAKEEFYPQQRTLLLDETACRAYFDQREQQKATAKLASDNTLLETLLQATYNTRGVVKDTGLKVQADIAKLLEQAVEKNLHTQDRIFAPTYWPGVEIHVGEVVQNWCKDYKIEIK